MEALIEGMILLILAVGRFRFINVEEPLFPCVCSLVAGRSETQYTSPFVGMSGLGVSIRHVGSHVDDHMERASPTFRSDPLKTGEAIEHCIHKMYTVVQRPVKRR